MTGDEKMRSWCLMLGGAFTVALFLSTGCSDDALTPPDAGKQPGTEGGPCYGNGTCNSGLVCASNLCVKLPDSAVPDMRESDGALPDLKLDLASHDALVPDQLNPDAPKTDATVPDALKPDLPISDLQIPDSASLDLPGADLLKPDASVPDKSIPDVLLPDTTPPDAVVPDAALPDFSLDAGNPVQNPSGLPISTAASYQAVPAVAFDGVNYLVVWQDYRSQSSYDIYAARVTTAGVVLDSGGIGVSTTSAHQMNPDVQFNGSRFLVVWDHAQKTAPTIRDIYGRHVSTAGKPLGSADIKISAATGDQSDPALACFGNSCMVVWQDNRGGSKYDIYAARVTSSGTVQDASGLPISTASGNKGKSAIAQDGSGYMVIWQDSRSGKDIFASRVTKSGTVLDPLGFQIDKATSTSWGPALTYGGVNYLATWWDNRNGTYDIFAARVSTTGKVLDPSGITVSTAKQHQQHPAAAYNGAKFIVVWQDARSATQTDIYGSRLTTSGLVLDSASTSIPISLQKDYQREPDVSCGGTNCLSVWSDERSGGVIFSDIYGTRIYP